MSIKIFSFITCLLICNICFAKIWRINNTPGIVADFTTAQTAHDAVTVLAGDTMHLEPSITSYGSLSASKRLIWISTGAFLSSHPGTQASLNAGSVTGISANAGSDNSVFSVNCTGYIYGYASGIRIERSYAVSVNFQTGGNNAVILNSYLTGDLYIGAGTNVIIVNNIVEGQLTTVSGTSSIITNNVFNAVTPSTSTVNNSTLQNNIFNKGATYTFVNCTVEYNMSAAATSLPSGNNNQNAINMTTVFINNNGNTDGDFVLKAGSPAIGSGTPASTDMGAYGGGSPFKIAVQPAIPSIYRLSAPAVPAGNTMSVIFSTKSNN